MNLSYYKQTDWEACSVYATNRDTHKMTTTGNDFQMTLETILPYRNQWLFPDPNTPVHHR